MDQQPAPALLRIGELSRRLGVSEHVLRAWERRYGLLRPVRSAGGFRLYTDADEDRVRRMQAHRARGLSAAEAAYAALNEQEPAPSESSVGERLGADRLADAAGLLAQAMADLDEPAAQAVLDRLFAGFTVEAVLRDAVLPYLRALGERWERGEVGVAGEHFASNVLRGRLTGLARGWGHGERPYAVLACAPGELHDLALLSFGIVLNRNGWRIDYLGTDTPIEDLTGTAAETHPDLVVVYAVTSERFDGSTALLSRLGRVAPLNLAGAGATQALADTVGATLLTGDPVTAAERMPRPG